VTGPDVEAYIDASGARYDDDPRREMFDRTLRDQPPPATMPAFGRSGLLRAGLPTVLRGSVGDLWVLEYVAFPGQPQAWSVFDPDGRLTRTVILPPGVELAHVGSDVLIAVTLDALDVEHVLVYDFAGLVPTGD
jgi:hypothetical protein